MTDENLDIKQIWKSASSDPHKIAKIEIAEFKKKRQKSIYASLQSTCLIQVFEKIIYGLALLFGLFIFRNAENILLSLTVIIFLNLILLGIDFRLLSRIRKLKHADRSIADALKKLERFLQTDFFTYRFYAAFSNPILIITGILYYSFYKYGDFELFTQIDSLIVFGTITLISFLIGYAGMVFSSHKIMGEVQRYNEILEESENYKKILERDRKRRVINLIITLVILITGILLFLMVLIK